MNKKVIAAFLAATMSIGILAGCGNADAGSEGTVANDSAASDAESAENAGDNGEAAEAEDASDSSGSEGESIVSAPQRLLTYSQMGMKARKNP